MSQKEIILLVVSADIYVYQIWPFDLQKQKRKGKQQQNINRPGTSHLFS